MLDDLRLGDILTVEFPKRSPGGREQEGLRPAIVVGLPEVLGPLRFPMVFVVPFTSSIGSWASRNPAAYPIFDAGEGGLSRPSVALIDQVCAVDRERIRIHRGSLAPERLAVVLEALAKTAGNAPSTSQP